MDSYDSTLDMFNATADFIALAWFITWAFTCMFVAKSKNRSGFNWFWGSFFFSFLALIVLALSSKRYDWECGDCHGGLTDPNVRRCQHCGTIFEADGARVLKEGTTIPAPLPMGQVGRSVIEQSGD